MNYKERFFISEPDKVYHRTWCKMCFRHK